ncbi:hypothetical protein EW145_g2009 [Phellinidium pouzarii]|uniref:Uncharacterized protein n=1 Tax=Phellinidium pouzarii TaxID=167371 RepID=A0A4S4LCN7_9AGAM|nr:hypothetical protein EW145_g2009 [Phellinidium pouzarii]
MSNDTSDSVLYGNYAFTDSFKSVHYGPGCITSALPKLLATVGAKTALVVTGRSLHTKARTDVVRKVEAVLRSHDAYGGTFWEIGEHTPVANVDAGVRALAAAGADVLVSVGGGSPIDAAKAIIYRHNEQAGLEKTFLPHIAVPTTLSAAEYTAGAGITNEEGHKVAVSAHALAPAGIILDAELTLPTPERLWLSTGIRALDHAVGEPIVPHPVKVLCYAAIAELFTFLPLSRADPTDVAARQRLQVAALMSLWPLKMETYSPLGISHSLGHKLGATYHISHGITSCLTLAPVVTLQVQIASPAHKRDLAAALPHIGIPSTGSVDGDILKLSSEIDRLVDQLGLKTDLAAGGVPRADVPGIAALALGSEENAHFEKVKLLLEGLYPN